MIRTFLQRALPVMVALVLCFPLPGCAADELITLKPGVTQRGAKPSTWTLDLRDAAKSQANAAQLSSRLYGPFEGELHQPLTVKTNSTQPVILGFHVGVVSRKGALLQLTLDGVGSGQKSWEAAGATLRPDKTFFVRVPPGEQTLKLEVTDHEGVVVFDAFYVAANAAQLTGATEEILLKEAKPKEAKAIVPAPRADGYRGIWFELGQKSEYGDKYSGGLGTYTSNHVPLAVYSPAADKTFFTYGGTREGEKHLLIMVGYYDHKTGQMPRPVIVHDKEGVDDPHDNGSLNIDDQGYLWLFVSGRNTRRPGLKFRSAQPYDISAWEQISTEEMTYPQPWFDKGQGFLHLFTKYTKGRELYFETSPDGRAWSDTRKLAGFGGHYQTSGQRGGKVGTFFNYHPNGNVDKRTNLYYAQTTDWGQNWTTVDGKPLELPLKAVKNPALVLDLEAQGKLMYTHDLNWDKDGNPLLLYVSSQAAKPGPGERHLTLTRWTGKEWKTTDITTVDHNYDTGSLWVEGEVWSAIAPTLEGPQKWQGGGELTLWQSRDAGATWTQSRQITKGSARNHNYARRPLNAQSPFYAFWADGDPTQFSVSQLYFYDAQNNRVMQMPSKMDGDFAQPTPLAP